MPFRWSLDSEMRSGLLGTSGSGVGSRVAIAESADSTTCTSSGPSGLGEVWYFLDVRLLGNLGNVRRPAWSRHVRDIVRHGYIGYVGRLIHVRTVRWLGALNGTGVVDVSGGLRVGQ